MSQRSGRNAHLWSGGESVIDTLSRLATAVPDRRALIIGTTELSYAELDLVSRDIAAGILARGILPGSRLGLCGISSVDLFCGMLGILRAGCSYVPLDVRYPFDRLRFIVEDAAIDTVIVAAEPGTEAAQRLPAQVMTVEECRDLSGSEPLPTIGGKQEAYVLYTSGSTGKPKGVSVAHWHLTRLMQSFDLTYELDHTDVWTVAHSFSFDWSVMELWGAWAFGGCPVIAPLDVLSNLLSFGELVQRHRVTVVNIGPSAFPVAFDDTTMRSEAPSSLRYLIFASERLDPHILRPYFSRLEANGTHVINLYGLTETTVASISHEIKASDLDSAGESPIGLPLPELEVTVRDERQQVVEPEVTGEIVVSGWGVADGYIGHAMGKPGGFVEESQGEETTTSYFTGDLGRVRRDGVLLYEGRADRQIKIRGFRIEPVEVEMALEDHPAVKRAIVTAENKGGTTRLVAYYTLVDGATEPESSALRTAIETRLPAQFVPSVFMPISAVPLTVNGKVDYGALAGQLIS